MNKRDMTEPEQTEQIDQTEQPEQRPPDLPELTQPLFPSRRELLDEAIEDHPTAPANYVFRGELLIEAGADELAAADFEKAMALIEAQAPDADWGYILTALYDRAQQGLHRVQS